MELSELYELLWSEPVSKVASRFGLSDCGLAKLCGRNNFPVPPRGYWARVDAGQYPDRAALPRPDLYDEVDLKDLTQAATPSANDETGAQTLSRLLFPRPEPKPPQQQDQPAPALHTAPAKQQVSGTVPGGSPMPTVDPFKVYSALDAECERAMTAGVEYQRRQAAIAMIKDLVAKAGPAGAAL